MRYIEDVTKYEEWGLLHGGASSDFVRKNKGAVMLIFFARKKESIHLCFREKRLQECYRNPYRQPTKVDW